MADEPRKSFYIPRFFSPQHLAAVAGVYLTCLVLHLIVPATLVEGYACDRKGRPLKYRLNGLRVLLIVDSLFIGLCECNILVPGWMRSNYWGMLNAANLIGLLCSLYLMRRGLALPNKELEPQMRCLTADAATPIQPGPKALHFFRQRSKSAHFYSGVEFNPRWKALPFFDLKMFLYVIGAVMLHLLVLDSCLAKYYDLGSRPSDIFASNDSRFNTAINTDSSAAGSDADTVQNMYYY
jgi:hypothetical protein